MHPSRDPSIQMTDLAKAQHEASRSHPYVNRKISAALGWPLVRSPPSRDEARPLAASMPESTGRNSDLFATQHSLGAQSSGRSSSPWPAQTCWPESLPPSPMSSISNALPSPTACDETS